MNPEISVILGVHNAAVYLQGSLESILSQPGPSFEVIVVDDGSTDETPQILAESMAQDARIRVVQRGHAGLTRSLNIAVGLARGAYLARHDADDISLAGRFARQLQFLKDNPALAAVGVFTDVIDYQGKVVGVFPMQSGSRRVRQAIAHIRSTPCHGAVMMHREAFESAGGYREAFKLAQDFDLWLRLLDRGEIDNLPETLYLWRLSRGGVYSTRRSQQLKYAGTALAFSEERRRFGADSYALLEECGGDLERFAAGYRMRGRLNAIWGALLFRGLRDPSVAAAHLRAAVGAGYWRPATLGLLGWSSLGLPWPGRKPLALESAG